MCCRYTDTYSTPPRVLITGRSGSLLGVAILAVTPGFEVMVHTSTLALLPGWCLHHNHVLRARLVGVGIVGHDPGNGLTRVGDAKLGVNIGEVEAHGTGTYTQLRRNLLIGLPIA